MFGIIIQDAVISPLRNRYFSIGCYEVFFGVGVVLFELFLFGFVNTAIVEAVAAFRPSDRVGVDFWLSVFVGNVLVEVEVHACYEVEVLFQESRSAVLIVCPGSIFVYPIVFEVIDLFLG